MNTTKRQVLEKTYQTFIEVCTNENTHFESLEPMLIEDIFGLGTTADERMFTKSDFHTMIKSQAAQSQGLNMKWHVSPIVHRVSNDGNSAVFIDDLTVTMSINGQPNKMILRCSIVFEFDQDKWMVVHWHASKPEEAESETDTYGIEQWKQKTIELEKIVAERTSDLVKKNKELETAINSLKATQTQLIQSEKMASLGELTAGIAHEIQNPLNFVNNFSEVSSELIEEMNEELAKGAIEVAKDIAADIKRNLDKINHHGKRADTIVKGMLQHSRKSTAEKELTDINKLADEYLRLAYHGLRAKDKSFNAILETDYDQSIGLINVIPQDIGRVILNLITNAFYAANERKKTSKDSKFQPTITVTTKRRQSIIYISVKDNGNGIPKHVLEKIFQPFFTTKPAGEGTGLGLSMSYDIVTKGHGGQLNVDTKVDDGTTFSISLSD